MIRKILILFVVLFVSIASHYSFAQQTTTDELLNSNKVASEPLNNDEVTSTRDTIAFGDSIIVIHTVCAPLCSSHVRVYDNKWKEIGILKAPFPSPFPEAYIENGKLLWRDNDTFNYEPAP